jgi:hypothetical protein
MEDKKKFRIVQIKDVYGDICVMAMNRFKRLPTPLPWIEPSINMLYLECVSSHIFGNDFCSIISMSVLLEHVLRLSLLDKKNTGLKRNLSHGKLNKIQSISKAIDMALSEGLIDSQDKGWWEDIAKIIRNKSAHYLIPKLIKEFTMPKYDNICKDRDKYVPKWYALTDKNGLPVSFIAHDWGMFFSQGWVFYSKGILN